MLKLAYIRKLDNDKYRVYSESGKNMGTYDSKSGAKQRLQQIEYFKHKDGASDGKVSKKQKMLKDLSNIADYLEEAGFVEEADEVYAVMGAVDGIHSLPNIQMNTENQGYIGGDGTGGGYSALNVPEGQPADDQDNVDMLAGSNGLWGNTVTDNGAAGQFNVLNDSFFYNGYGDLEGRYR